MKKIITILLFVTLPFMAAAESLSKIGVVDISKVLENFPTDSSAFRKLDLLKLEYDDKLPEYLRNLQDIEQRLLDVQEEGSEYQIASLEREVEDYKNFIRTWRDTMIKRINTARENLADGSPIIIDVMKAIEWVAINEGFTLVFDAAERNIIWWSMEVDITEMVIERLRVLARTE